MIFKVDDVCATCKNEHCKKLLKNKSLLGNIPNTDINKNWQVRCAGRYHTEALLTNKTITEEEAKIAMIHLDPIHWANMYLNWKPRFYQELMLRCTAKRKVMRLGRRNGKTDCMCVDMLFHAFTSPGVRILVVAPYKNQVELIFTRLTEFIEGNPDLLAKVCTKKSNPFTYAFEFKKGDQILKSRILGLTSGTKSGNKGDSIRGQGADRIYFDEADYMDQGDIDTLLPIITEDEERYLWASSTPTGKRNHFYTWCHTSRFKEFYYPSSASPKWGPLMEAEMVESYGGKTSPGYQHEVLAEFGEEAEGVFNNNKIDESLREYAYYSDADVVNDTEHIRCIGIDWNKTHGTHYIVAEWTKESNKFKVIDHSIIHATEYNDMAAMNEVVRLNEVYNPAYIYVDRGYGDTKVELLHKYGVDNPKSGLATKLKAIDFGSNIEVTDPWAESNEIVKKKMKPFIVNIASNFLDQDRCILPAHEDIKNDTEFGSGVVADIRDYAVIKVTVHGQPTYSTENDHTVVAWMLALFAFHQEFANIFEVSWASFVGFAPGFGREQGADLKMLSGNIETVVKRAEKDNKTVVVPERDSFVGVKNFRNQPTIGTRPRKVIGRPMF